MIDWVDAACGRALEAGAVSVSLIGRMLERATETDTTDTDPVSVGPVRRARFARDPEHFATATKPRHRNGSSSIDGTAGGVA